MLKIAMIGQKGIPARFGGVETHVHDLSARLAKIGHTVTAYSRKWYTKKDTAFIDEVLAKSLPSIRTKHFDTISHTFLATIDAINEEYDIIHYHGVGPALLSWVPRLFAPNITVITTFHSIDRKHAKWGTFAKMILTIGEWMTGKFAHKTISVSRTIQQYMRDVYDVETTYIPNGVPNYKKSTVLTALQTWNLQPDKYIIAVSRLIKHKGIHYLILAFKDLKLKNPELLRDMKLVIVGDGYYTNEYVTSLKKLAQDLSDSIIFTGFQSGEILKQLFSHAHMMIHPSDQEGLPITVLEGMSFSLPVLVSDIPEHRELVTDKRFLFKRSNIEDLKVQIQKILLLNTETKILTGKQNKQLVHDDYNWETIVHNTELVYERGKNLEVNKANKILLGLRRFTKLRG